MQLRLLVTLALAAATAACGGGGAAPVTGGGGETVPLGSVSLTHPEGAVPVGDTMILKVEARDGSGQPVAGIQPQFTSSDVTVATVDAAGVVRGLKAGAATITASVTVGEITKSANFGVAILDAATQPPPANNNAIAAFALNPATVTLATGGTAPLEPVATNAAGARVTPLPQLAWSVQDGTRASVAGGVVTAVAAGATIVTASFTAGGRTWAASANVIVTEPNNPAPVNATVQGVEDAFTPSSVTITPGGTVTWTMVDEEHDVTFTGAAPPGGSIGRIDRDESASRTFPTAGTYAYTCSRHDGDHGGTVVVNEGAGQAPVFTSVRIGPVGPSVTVGGTLLLTATPLDQLGRPMSGLPAAQWSSADATRATVDAGGTVTGVATSEEAINDAGQVAFVLQYDDGSGVTRLTSGAGVSRLPNALLALIPAGDLERAHRRAAVEQDASWAALSAAGPAAARVDLARRLHHPLGLPGQDQGGVRPQRKAREPRGRFVLRGGTGPGAERLAARCRRPLPFP